VGCRHDDTHISQDSPARITIGLPARGVPPEVAVVRLNALGFASLAYVANRRGQHAMAALLAGEHGCLA
jgi:hypothetical protein